MKAVITQDPKHYNKKDLLPEQTIVNKFRLIWRNHGLVAIVFTYNNRPYRVWAQDVTFIH